MWQEAERLVAGGDLDRALDSYRLLVQQFRDDALAPDALLEVARLERLRDDPAAARATVAQLTERYPRSPAAAEGFWLAADLAAESATSFAALDEARTTFRRVPLLYGRDAYPVLPARVAARVRSAELGILLEDFAGAQADLLAAIEEEPATEWTPRARLLLARTYLPSAEWVAAAEILQQVVDDGEDPAAAEARRLLSLIHRRVVRPRGGSAWGAVARFPPSGLALREPTGVAADRDGEVLVLDDKDHVVAYLAEDGSVVARRTLEGAGRPGFTLEGEPYVLREGAAELLFGGTRATLAEPGRGGPLKSPYAAVRTAGGTWLVAAKGFRSVLAYEAVSGRVRDDLLADRRPEPEDLAIDDYGRIYVLDREGRQVLRLGPDGRFLGIAARGEWRKPVAVAVDSLGYVYVLDRGASRVEIFDPAGQRSAAIGPEVGGAVELRDPVDLAVDGAGRVFVADRKLPFLVLFE